MIDVYPDDVAGPYEPPPRTVTDGAGREIRIEPYAGGGTTDEDGTDGGEAAKGSSDDATDGTTDVALEEVVDMYLAFDPEDRAQGIPPTTEERIRDWLDTILDETCHNVLAWDVEADRVVGHATLVPDGEGAYELAIFVLATHQGAGIGTELLEALLGLGREAGVERVWLTVERWNNPAIHLYEKVGFEPADAGSFEKEMAARLG